MAPFQVVKTILRHPLNRGQRLAAVFRYIRWQIGLRLLRRRVLVEWVGGTRFFAGLAESGVAGNVYCGLLEFADMAFALHFLRDKDLFMDVGANAGVYTLLACGVVRARGVAVEAVPSTYRRLLENIELNHLGARVVCHNVAAGQADGIALLSEGMDCSNHVVEKVGAGTVEVPVRRLDDLLPDQSPLLLKIDVEGYEVPALRGAMRILANPGLWAVLMELNGSGKRYGFDEEELHRSMLNNGFSSYTYEPFTRELRPLDGARNVHGNNTLYLREAVLADIRQRVRQAPARTFHGWTF